MIIGGGASGLACAVQLKMLSPKSEVTILEQNDRIGKKILKTGNGRCNISNLNISEEYYNNQDFMKQCLKQFSVADLNSFFLKLGLVLKSDDYSRRYPYSEKASTVLDVFLSSLQRYGIEVICNQKVLKVKKNNVFRVITEDSEYQADTLVFATGSIAQERSNGYDLIKNLGHKITKLRPGLVPIKVQENLKSLQGLRIKCYAKIANKEIEYGNYGEILFKDQGLSGILSLDLSRYSREGSIIKLDLLPSKEQEEELLLLFKNFDIKQALMGTFPKMLVYEILKRSPEGNVEEILQTIHNFKFHVTGDYGFNIAQITLGGVEIAEVNTNFSSKKDDKLYIIGEVLDIDGASGGYNLHFAWMSGILAAKAIAVDFEKK
jgi:predicted Rossmann fold flavoprotein